MKKKTTTSDIFEAAKLAKEERSRLQRRQIMLNWIADHIVEALALIIAIIALIRTF